jgi:UPF0176 protein
MRATSNPEVKSEAICHSAFYKFVRIDTVETVIQQLHAISKNLLGSILVAEEGINGVIAGPKNELALFEAKLTDRQFSAGIFRDMIFKRSHCKSNPFARLKIHHKKEIVALGVSDINAIDHHGIYVTPQQWRTLLNEQNVVVIDNRNSFEFRLGHFKSAIDPQLNHFRELSHYIPASAPEWLENGKKIAMYCTGGIRCEKTSALMHNLGIDIVQLEGGILNYFQTIPDADLDWEGECFVFDKRIALNTKLNETTTTADDVYSAPEDAWRLARARALDSPK